MKKNKLIIIVLMAALLAPVIGCKKYLNVNSDPDTIQEPSPSSVLPPMLANVAYGLQRDGRYISKYIGNFHSYSAGITDVNFDNHGYIYSNTNMGDLWWATYYGLGKNLNYIIEKGIAKEQYDYVGVAYAIKAWSFQALTDEHNDIIYNEAWRDTTYFFHYDPQDVVYRGVDSLCRIALQYMDQAAGMTVSTLKAGDLSYQGDLKKWRKLVYGILARNYNHLSNKTGIYNADSVIKFCDSSFTSVNDDFAIPFDGTKLDNTNFWGPFRGNMNLYRQSNFIIRLLDGTTFTGSSTGENRDPRLSHMLSCSADTTNGNGGYYGINPGISEAYVALNPPSSYLVNGQPPTSGTALTNWRNARKKTVTPYGDSVYTNPAATSVSDGAGKYLFKNKAVMPVMTYAELQFIKAEAALRKNEPAKAYTAYLNGINGHYDFINRGYSNYRSFAPLYNILPIPAIERARYLASNNVKQSPATLTLTDIMLQKYIAMWGWGFLETWVDLRRYHYTDPDPATTQPVYKNYQLPTTFAGTNNGKPANRIRPNYQSEYVWNLEELQKLGGTKADYHTLECWFSQP